MPRTLWAVIALGGLAAIDVLRRAAHLLPSDAYLALVCGRYVATHGLPTVDTLATVTRGRPWVDEQWLGQLLIYGIDKLGGLRMLLASEAVVTAGAFAVSARYALKRGSTFVSVAVLAVVGILFCGIFCGVRPQMFSLALFAMVLAVSGEDTRSHKIFLIIPVLVVWANIHGAVILGAGVVGLRAAFSLVQAVRNKTAVWPPLALGVIAAASPFVSPYAAQLPGYFADIGHLQDPARELPILEWLPLDWSMGWLFFLCAGVVAFFFAWRPRHWGPNAFETTILLLTALAAWRANRNLQWFALALAAYGPAFLQPYLNKLRTSERVHQLCAALVACVVVALSVRLVSLPLESDLPSDALPVLHQALLVNPDAGAVMSDRFADWALWNEPLLAGRLAFDVRFELLDDPAARDVATFLAARPGAQSLFPDAKIALVSKRLHWRLSETLTHAPEARVLWDSDLARVLLRGP